MDIFQMSLSASVFIIAVVIVRALALHKLPKKTFLILWGLVLCRLLFPYSIPSRFSFNTGLDILSQAFTETTASTVSSKTNGIPYMDAFFHTGQSVGIDMETASISPFMVIWLGGMTVCAVFFIATYIKNLREFQTSLPIENDFITHWLLEHPLWRTVQIRQSDKINSPLTYGVFRPVVLLPKTTNWTDNTKLPYILTHELVHIKRFDALTKLFLAFTLCVHWFNPFMWVMYVLANRDIELSCDESVVKTFGETIKSVYAMTLIGMEEKKNRLTLLTNNFSKYIIEERIVSIMRMKKNSLAGAILAVSLVVGIPTLFATNSALKANLSPNNITPVVEKVVPVNPVYEQGQTYGHGPYFSGPTQEPDLMGAKGENGVVDVEKVVPVYPVNEQGQTYGHGPYPSGPLQEPDLMSAKGEKGVVGYVKSSDLDSQVSSPEEAMVYQESMEGAGYKSIPLYESDGKTVIGEYRMSNGH